ncbi:hypothetical protein CEXT_4061 [Caerostris extrusa]|uniref:Uncharacterized protein n=1 Tax=Caerostris extrusa TaxID=172846 RepID=A0AAV4QSE6_CAEEX|nr:hypothetical protein CEXT_4061 [Caerostris extrusa]
MGTRRHVNRPFSRPKSRTSHSKKFEKLAFRLLFSCTVCQKVCCCLPTGSPGSSPPTPSGTKGVCEN